MNLAIHGLIGNLGPTWGDTFARDLHPDLQADYVLANPPFNIKDWARREDDARWRFGVPPAGNANYAWIQHILSKLAPNGQAGVVMANGSMSTNSGGEGQIRARVVEADLVSAMVALPTQLFRSTGIPVCVWFFAKNKNWTTDRSGQVLFIDARNLGHMVDRAERALSDEDIAKIADTYRAWRGETALEESARNESALLSVPVESARNESALLSVPEESARNERTSRRAAAATYEDILGFCKSATLAEIKDADYALTPGRYVGTAVGADDGDDLEERIKLLTSELVAALDESVRLDAVVRVQMARLP